MTDTTFADLGLSDDILKAIDGLGYESPSPIQAQAIPHILQGKDIVGLSATGSGKTAAFTLPALQMIDLDQDVAQVLILSPTRELCMQVCEEVHRLGGKMKGLRAVPVYGGTPIDRQIMQLRKGAHIIVGTPGRLLDHLRRKTLKPSTIKLAILDEADRMLDMGFREDMEDLLGAMQDDHQTLFFSATMNKQVEKLIQRFGNEPQEVSIKGQTKTVSTVSQCYYEVRNRSKVEVLTRLLDLDTPRLAVIFCNTKRSVDECTEALTARGYTADKLHGDIGQQARERTTKRFREGKFDLLIATDVAARGLDIDDVEAVFNYDIPQDPEDYVHRIGRTGRAGREGRAVSFVFGRDIYRLQSIERYTKQHIKREKIPTQEQVEGVRADQLFELVQTRLEKEVNRSYRHYIDRLLDQGHTATDIAAGVFELLRESLGREGESIAEDSPDYKPGKQKKDRKDRRDRPERGERGERGERFNKRDRKGGKDQPRDPNMVTIFISLGKAASVRPADILGMFYGEGGIPDASVGRIQLFERHSLVDVNKDCADQLVDKLSNSKLRNQRFRIGLDRMG
ncbi:DEAD/DEAH box helicase [Verrucomicrobiaceae bacterium 5K15]|uniref:RNA helicase n=1 Tax=Oceaniferula flava TaxID=2800421 RepID=A0AAE2S9B1_9BACT|nr:DEAD/DEAH box helicase [Oceaniferula flavus]MBK1853373.1 DEAD/DEAH box helicase [Oceaniferula flavus]MBM1134678.1 DEAD/DEAH box helicase [Oceaniferula flavus]